MNIKRIIPYIMGAFGGSPIPNDAVIEPDGSTPLYEPNGDFVLEP